MASHEDLAAHKISGLPDGMYYIADFISAAEEAKLLSSLSPNRWIQLQHRRLQTHPSALSKSNVLLESPLPPWLVDPIIRRFHSFGLFEGSPHQGPNHVLINEYKPGEGIMPHEDGAAYYPVVATVSLSSSLCLDIHEKKRDGKETSSDADTRPQPRWRVLQEPRSLLVTCGSAYTDTLHGIAETETDESLGPQTVANWTLLGDANTFVQQDGRNERQTRISLTYRDVLKVSKAGARILGKLRV